MIVSPPSLFLIQPNDPTMLCDRFMGAFTTHPSTRFVTGEKRWELSLLTLMPGIRTKSLNPGIKTRNLQPRQNKPNTDQMVEFVLSTQKRSSQSSTRGDTNTEITETRNVSAIPKKETGLSRLRRTSSKFAKMKSPTFKAVTLRCFSLALSNSFRNFSASSLNLSSLNTKNTRENKKNSFVN